MILVITLLLPLGKRRGTLVNRVLVTFVLVVLDIMIILILFIYIAPYMIIKIHSKAQHRRS